MRVLQVSAEIFPLLKTGGLADVAGALPAALLRQGVELRALLPGFPAIEAALADAVDVAPLPTPWGDAVQMRYGRLAALDGLPAYVVHAPALYGRPGNPYHDAHGQPYADNHRRFALLGWAAARLAQGLDAYWAPRVVHSHDWHAALANAYIALAPASDRAGVGTVYTVHNLAYQGLFAPQLLGELGLPPSAFAVAGLEFHGQLSFMKAGLYYAQRITTVSPSYAREIQTPEQGFGLDGLLRDRASDTLGILNGVDEGVWNPAADAHIPVRFDAGKPGAKARCKAALQADLGLAVQDDKPLFAIVSRLAEQKGLPLLLAALPEITSRGGQLALLGSGDAALETAFREAAAALPQQVAVRIGYDEPHAHRLFAGSDVTLVPSLYEPCGLTQMYGLRYGSLPLVRRVGGLADTVVDCSLENMAEGSANGFVFDRFAVEDLGRAIRRAFALHARHGDWRAVQRRAMAQHFGWDAPAAAYAALYRQLAA
ncbi:glycogen/starch synthase, ADP-glucose type [Burkholderiales bacterium JOSHI_001]|nr:glycogen/starch synthase, ADP-glucose type [Burkholderiales bacterium JOSHI_001]